MKWLTFVSFMILILIPLGNSTQSEEWFGTWDIADGDYYGGLHEYYSYAWTDPDTGSRYITIYIWCAADPWLCFSVAPGVGGSWLMTGEPWSHAGAGPRYKINGQQ